MNRILIVLLVSSVSFTLKAQITHSVTVAINQPIECGVVAGLETSGLFKVFPNPVTQSFTIESAHLSNAVVTLVDIQGREVLKRDFKGEEISVDVSGLRKGIYILRVVSGSKSDKIKISIK